MILSNTGTYMQDLEKNGQQFKTHSFTEPFHLEFFLLLHCLQQNLKFLVKTQVALFVSGLFQYDEFLLLILVLGSNLFENLHRAYMQRYVLKEWL